MGRGTAAEKEEVPADKRVTWMEQRINACLKFRANDMKKFLENEDNRAQFTDFLETTDTRHLFIYALPNGTYVARTEAPEEIKRKGMYFAKVTSCKQKITDETHLRTSVTFGDLAQDTLENLNTLAKNFYMPLISRNRANTQWVPDVARPEFLEATHNFMAQLLVTLGLSQGKTLLPIPPIQLPARVDEIPQDKDLIYQLEAATMSWSSQIRAAMQSSPEEMLEVGAANKQHPGPLDEITFWKVKSENLSHLEEQVHSPKILKILVILKKAESKYQPPFQALLDELKEASIEARDNYRYLKPLTEEFELINPSSSNKMDFNELVPNAVFKKLFHFLYLLWTNSEYYNTAARLVVLIREMCNDLIECARENVNVGELFSGEPADAMQRLSQTLAVCGQFKAAYFAYKSKAAKTSSPWKFQNTALFSRLDSFLERCHDLLDLLETANLFTRMEQMKIGGTSGVELSTQAESVREEFLKAFQQFQSVEYDLLDVDEPRFDVDYGKFRGIVRELEMRMAAMLSESVDDAKSFGNLFKTVDTFDGFTDRPIVSQEWSKKQQHALEAYHEDLILVQEMFNKDRDVVASYPNMPPTATSLIWARALLERISEPYPQINNMSKALLKTELGVETLKLYQSLSGGLKSFIHQAHDQWASQVGQVSSEKLKLNLLVKDENGKLAVNFDPQLVKTLREVSYLEILSSFETNEDSVFAIPPQAAALFKQQETYRSQLLKLDFITTTYNSFMESMRDEDEKPLLRQELDLFEADMAKGLRELQWQQTEQIDEFISGAMKSVTSIEAVVGKMHGNLKQMQDLVTEFIKSDKMLPLNPARSDKTLSETDFRKKLDENNKTRKQSLTERGQQIHGLLGDTLQGINDLKASSGFPILDSDTEVWCHYVEFVNGVVRDLVCDSVVNSLKLLRDQLDPAWLEANDGIPLLEVRLALTRPKESSGERPEARFEPGLSNREGSAQSVDSLINEVISNINTTATYISRLDTGDAADNYLSEVLEHKEANQLAKQINELLQQNTEHCQAYMASFAEFRHLYESDMRTEFNKFVEHSEESSAPSEDQKTEPQEYFGVSLNEYDKAITEYEKIAERITTIEERRPIGFVRIDVKPIRSALSDVCRRWKEMYSGHLTSKIERDLTDLNNFIKEADRGLDQEVLDGNLESLKSVMKHIRDCRKRHETVMGIEGKSSGMFPPIQAAIQMLKGHPLNENEQSTLEQLEEMRKPAPEAWNNLFKKSLTVRAQNSIVQDREAEKIKEQMVQFDERINRVAQDFRGNDLFSYGVDYRRVYDDVDAQNRAFLNIEDEAQALRNLQELFDLTASEFKELRDCRGELMMLKHMWDLVAHIKMIFSDWMKSTFRLVDVDAIVDELKKLQKQLKSQPVKVKSWKCFTGLEEEVKNMATALPLCAELRNPAMRDRHWKLLLQTTKYQGHIDPEADDFTLERLIEMGLHRFAEDVSNIVEKASKELSIEKALTKIIDIWDKMAFTYDHHDTLDTYLLGPIDEIVEQLEADNNTLQGMLSNRFVEYFFDKVTLWQRNLGSVDTCINKWMEIQRQWMNLFPIFVLSADIKEQLPDDAKNFQIADDMFRALMSKAHKYTNVIEVVCSDVIKTQLNKDQELEEMLVIMQDILTQCEKALTEYLETKRKVFPRFYFVSATDLIDILSKGSDPKAVMVHMSKIVDSIDVFSMDGNPNASAGPKDIYNLISVQGEVVPLPQDYTCDGPVEDWLNGCIDAMQKAIRFHIQEANSGYTDKPRHEWIYSYTCQAIIVASRIWFTNEVHQAFAQLEEGNDGGMKECLKNQKSQLDTLIQQVLLNRTSNERKMLVHLITIDVHSRDVVQTLVDEKTDAVDSFTWQSQLRYYWDEKKGSEIRICDAEFINGYEYIGLCGCLVITKLTDRCYITLSQALRLKKGGAPAGPAGTGKTETTKDLARNLGIACYVFNCSDQMNYLSLGQIFKGLAMSGSWGCFDEFNRISIEVLSVVATQVGSILNALKAQKKRFRFMDEEIPIIPSVGMWITMNPGYAGRTELPENIKSLFRPCAMCVPDLKNICEIMLAAEGFIEAKDLALKFVTLYRLNRELLSPQRHYDWGLRAVKSVLYIAGALKRGDPDTPERNVLMRALRDTNMAKLSKDDVYVFMGLIQALFPRLEVPKKEKLELVDACKQACKEMGNLPGENDIFILKCVQYEELLHVRHSVFVLGPAGSGKTQCWRCLQNALAKLGDKCQAKCLNPKAITSNELYGYFHPQTKEWKDGILSSIFRDFAVESKTKKNSKWMVLDGIIDAEWIESMNTVMDDNKMLTLVSNERIPLTSSMRMIFEISHLNNASPATVSRAGVVFINESDLGWIPFKDKWLVSRHDDKESTMLDSLFDKYVPLVFEFWRKYKPVVGVMDINIIQTICYMLEGMLTESVLPKHGQAAQIAEIYEKIFCFAVVWAFGGPLPGADGRVDMRGQFSAQWRKDFPTMKMSDVGTVFDYYLDTTDYEWKPWSNLVEPYRRDPEEQLSNVTVQTADTVRMSFLMSLFIDHGKPVMLVGTSGTGKTNLIMSKLQKLDSNNVIFRVIAFNARTSSGGLQAVMEQNLEKRGGKSWGPFNRKKLVFFFDDMNMAEPDKYGTQEAIALIQQHYSYGFWYDRNKIGPPKEVVDLRYVGAMNPKSGTFTILDRLLRQFAVFATNVPDKADLVKIYGQILRTHLEPFHRDIKDTFCTAITNATIDLHIAVTKNFLPTAIKFYYQWNMREMFNIFQGICKSSHKLHNDTSVLSRLWLHECNRTFRDRMSDEADMAKFDGLIGEVVKQIPDVNVEEVMKQPILWGPFTTTKEGDEGVYDQTDIERAFKYITQKLGEYNETFSRMDLVLFTQAIEHVCRIARITSNPRGNAMLVGVGGSGKQSLARLASFINGQDAFQILVTSNYGINEFRTDVQEIYRRSGIKSQLYAFIITDSQIVSMDMLVYLNDMLSSGNVPDLFNQEERDGVIGSIMNEVKASGHPDFSNADVCWDFFINKVRTNLHIILCFSPVGDQFAKWCRQFPALSNTTVIDYFHPWPEDALRSVAKRFLAEIDLESEEMTTNLAEFMARSQAAIVEQAEEYYRVEKRRCYVTPKSFLELISLYKAMLAKKRSENDEKVLRLETGLEKIKEAGEQVSALQDVLKRESVEVEEARMKTAKLMETVGREKAIVTEQSDIAEIEEAKTNKIVVEVESFQAECQRDLAAAQPLVDAALAALDTLNKNSLTELKSMGKPPDDVVMVACAVRVLTSDPKNIPAVKNRNWAEAKKMMANVTGWLKELQAFDCNNIPQPCIDALEMYVSNPAFDPKSVATKSAAASGLCQWALGMNEYHKVRCDVKPKEERLAEASVRLESSKAALKKIQDRVGDLKSKLDVLLKQYNDAVEAANAIEAKAKKTRDKADLATRLVSGLGDENKRWGLTISDLKLQARLLVGDVLLGAAFISFIGPFSKAFREKIVHENWMPAIEELKIPVTKGLDVVMHVLTSEATVASWNNEGLPSDRVSTENGSIVTNCSRWPLMIDPQLQGVKWIRTREEKNGLKVIQTGGKGWLQTLATCIEEGLPCLLESLGESIEPILENVLGRITFKKGGRLYVKLGAQDIEYNAKFRFYLQTKLGNPLYKPEVNAQATLINFMVTETGLEDQLLAVVVNQERPDLEEKRVALLRQMNTMTIELQQCEDGLLFELSNAKGDILENVTLVENLEATKKTAKEINASMEAAVKTQQVIAQSRLTYTAVAVRGSLLFFQIDQLCKIDHMYQYSLEAFMVVFNKALMKAEQPEDKKDITRRVDLVLQSITQTVFAYVSRGLFERHKLIFSSLLCFAILNRRGDINAQQLDFLLRGKKKSGIDRPETVAEWCPEPNWAAVQALAEVEGATPSFETLPADMGEHNRWRQWSETEKPEDEKLPTDWKNLTPFQKLLILRCLRPDRLTSALETFVSDSIGRFFVSDQAVPLAESFKDSGATTPLFFILSPGVDPVRQVEVLGQRLGYTYDNEKLYNVSLGQGQEIVAERALEACFEKGGWAMLNNIHLVAKWLIKLEKRLDSYSEIYTKMGQIAKRKAEKRAAKRALLKAQAGGDKGEGEEQEETAKPEGVAEESEQPAESTENAAPVADEAAAVDETNAEPGAESEEVVEEEEEEDDDDPELKMDGPKGAWDFRVFLSAEPSNVIPIGVLQRCIKLTSEPPTGIAQNIKRAFMNFSDEPWERSSKPTEFRAVTFAMCFFHAVVVERKKFGAQGWNRVYPFNVGDLTTCIDVLGNYIDDRPEGAVGRSAVRLRRDHVRRPHHG
jgi:dynein heavy chain